MQLLLIHQNFPGQFRDLAPAWLKKGHQLTAISAADSPAGDAWRGLFHCRYLIPEKSSLTVLERGKTVGKICRKLKKKGFNPDLVLAHSGWGEALQLRGVWEQIPIVVMPELWGCPSALGFGFDDALNGKSLDGDPFLLPNLVSELSIVQANAAVVASRSQFNSFPKILRKQLTLLAEGLDLKTIRPNRQASIELPQINLKAGDPIVTFVSRQLEPLRGLRQVLRAWSRVSKAHCQAHLLLIGDEFDYGYGVETPQGPSHLQDAMDSWDEGVDRNRIHFLGHVNHSTLMQILQCSACHLAMSYPYTLSWSVLEAMACAAPVITNVGSPVEPELIHDHSGLIIPFNDVEALSDAILQLLSNLNKRKNIGLAGRKVVEERFNLEKTLQQYEKLFQRFQRSQVPSERT